MSSTISRRLSVTTQQSHDEAIRAELFTTFSSYGVMESFTCQDNANYDQSVVTVQFQRLSSAEQLQADALRSGRQWQVQFLPAVQQTSSEVLVSSRRPLKASALEALRGDLGISEAPAPPSGGGLATTTPSARTLKGSTGFFEEKMLRVPGRGTGASQSSPPDSSRGSSGGAGGSWAQFAVRNVAVVGCACVGPYVGLLRFKDTHSANAFLLQHQQTLAKTQDLYLQYVPPPPPAGPSAHSPRGVSTAPLHIALHTLLTRQPLSALREGDVLRGFIVESHTTALCSVDAGVVDDSAPRRTVLLVDTHTSFLKTRLRDEVQVQVRSVDHAAKSVHATLLHVVADGSVAAVSASGRLAGTRAQKQQQQQQQQQQQEQLSQSSFRVSSQQPFGVRTKSGGTLGGSTPGSTPPSSQDTFFSQSQASLSQSQPKPSGSGSAGKSLASRLFQSIQQRKKDGTLFGGTAAGGSGERITAFPSGLYPCAQLLVRVERVEADGTNPGVHATCISADAERAGGAGGWSVFVPAALVPTAPGGPEWHAFAVAGERMSVALLYAVSVGDSAATLRCIASKLEEDMRHATVAGAAVRGGGTGGELPSPGRRQPTPMILGGDDSTISRGNSSQLQLTPRKGASVHLQVGTLLKGLPMRVVEPGDIGTSGSRQHFPAWAVLPTDGGLPDLLCVLPLRLAPERSPSLSPSITPASAAAHGSTAALDLVVSEVVHDGANGHYAVVMDAAAYRAAEDRALAEERRKQKASRDEIKRKLAAVLGEDAVSDDSEDADTPDTKRERHE